MQNKNFNFQLFFSIYDKINVEVNVQINDRKVVITFVATVLRAKFSKDNLTALIPSELGILVYKDHTSRDSILNLYFYFFFFLIWRKPSSTNSSLIKVNYSKYEFHVWYLSILLIFHKKASSYLVHKTLFVELLAEGDNLHALKYLMCES